MYTEGEVLMEDLVTHVHQNRVHPCTKLTHMRNITRAGARSGSNISLADTRQFIRNLSSNDQLAGVADSFDHRVTSVSHVHWGVDFHTSVCAMMTTS